MLMLFDGIVFYLQVFDLKRLVDILYFHSCDFTNESHLYTIAGALLFSPLCWKKFITMSQITFLLLRLAIGASMFGHGLVRLPKLNGFSHWMVGLYEKSILPTALVMPFSYILPLVEFAVGLLLLLGLFTRLAAVAGGVIMVLLIFGTTMIENWEAIASQLIHAAFFAILLQFVGSNSWALDKLVLSRSQTVS